jgi:hypothetical protein
MFPALSYAKLANALQLDGEWVVAQEPGFDDTDRTVGISERDDGLVFDLAFRSEGVCGAHCVGDCAKK